MVSLDREQPARRAISRSVLPSANQCVEKIIRNLLPFAALDHLSRSGAVHGVIDPLALRLPSAARSPTGRRRLARRHHIDYETAPSIDLFFLRLRGDRRVLGAVTGSGSGPEQAFFAPGGVSGGGWDAHGFRS